MRLVLLSIFLAATLLAQFEPEGSQVISCFPQLADGGPPSQQWVTTLTFVNPNSFFPVDGTAFFLQDDGTDLMLDFGNGPVSSFDFSISPLGNVTFTSTGASPATVTGWAAVYSSLPVQGVVQFRNSVNGVPQQGVSAQSTAASVFFRSPATASTGVAIANPYGDQTPQVGVAVIDGSGNQLASKNFTMTALGHRAFNVNQMFPTVPATFRGTVEISSQVDQPIVAWTLSTEGGVLSSYPPSGLGWPSSPWEHIWKVWAKLLFAAPQLIPPTGVINLRTEPDLNVTFTNSTINTYADTAKNTVHMYMNLAMLTSDSDSELAFVLGHELGHIIQAQAGRQAFNSTNAERDADAIGIELAILAGYDPYGAAGALGKLFMASGTAKLIDLSFDNLGTHGLNPQTSFQDRLGAIYGEIQAICAIPGFPPFCSALKTIEHPEFPHSAPLRSIPHAKAKW